MYNNERIVKLIERVIFLKTTIKTMDYEKVMSLPRPERKKPLKPNWFWRILIRILCVFGMMGSGFTYKKERMELLGKKEPCLILMNHTCFLDMEVAQRLLFPRPLNIVCSNDGFIGFFGLMSWLMRQIGCVATQKYVSDLRLVQDMEYCLKNLKSSVLMYPEAGYSFDGTATTLPDSLGRLVKMMKVPVVTIITHGAFHRDPLYNGLQLRKVKVSADVKYLLSPEDIAEKSADELNAILQQEFSFDNFRWQQVNEVVIDEKFRADGLHRVLYKCAHCGCEHAMEGKGTELRCNACGKVYTLTEIGFLEAKDGDTRFDHIPDWYAWQREEVRKEILDGTYKLDTPVDISMLVDTKCLYNIGEGRLLHTEEGFRLTDNNGRLYFSIVPQASYSLNADYFWYEIGDVISIGDRDCLFYCFPKEKDVVVKARLAQEELYKLKKKSRRAERKTEE